MSNAGRAIGGPSTANNAGVRPREEERFNRAAVTAALAALGIVAAPVLPVPVLDKLLETARRALDTQGNDR